MQKSLGFLVFLVLSLPLVGCGGGEVDAGGDAGGAAPASGGSEGRPAPVTEADRGMVAYLGGFDEMIVALRDVHDEASAEAAGKTIQEVADRLNEKADAMEALSDQEIGAAAMRYAGALQKVQLELSQVMLPVMMNPQHAQHIQSAMKAMPKPPSKE